MEGAPAECKACTAIDHEYRLPLEDYAEEDRLEMIEINTGECSCAVVSGRCQFIHEERRRRTEAGTLPPTYIECEDLANG